MASFTTCWKNTVFGCLLGASFTVGAFQLSPTGTLIERQGAALNLPWYQRFLSGVAEQGVYNFTHPVHEEITHRIYGCLVEPVCQTPESEYAPATVIAGVRWNDDPPFKLTSTSIKACKVQETIRVITQPVCWYELFKDAEKKSKTTYFDAKAASGNLMYRSHFGDLQFLHAMATKDGEPASVTQANILMWGEFAWAVASGAYGGGQKLSEVTIAGFDKAFGSSGWTVQDLYSLGNPALRAHLPDVAFGSLLHLLEDSFAAGHAERRDPVGGAQCASGGYPKPGKIVSFHSYTNQDHKRHGDYDAPEAMQKGLLDGSVNVITVGQNLRAMYGRKQPWPEVRAYLECVFDLEDPNTEAGPGPGFSE